MLVCIVDLTLARVCTAMTIYMSDWLTIEQAYLLKFIEYYEAKMSALGWSGHMEYCDEWLDTYIVWRENGMPKS